MNLKVVYLMGNESSADTYDSKKCNINENNSEYTNYTILGVACKIPFTGKQQNDAN